MDRCYNITIEKEVFKMKNKIRILLIEDNPDKRSEFKYCMKLHSGLELCGETGSQKEGLQLLKNENVDVVILDLELEEGNGINFAEEMRSLPIRQPFVAVTTNTSSTSILQYLRIELEVDFIFQKTNTSYTPEQVLDVIEKVYKYHTDSNPNTANELEILKERIYHELQNIGFSSDYIGTDYLVEALMMIAEHPEESLPVSKVIYPAIAKKYHSDSSSVERAIRTSIERVWSNANLMTLSKYYPYDIENKNGRPSNGEFIAKMKLKLFGR